MNFKLLLIVGLAIDGIIGVATAQSWSPSNSSLTLTNAEIQEGAYRLRVSSSPNVFAAALSNENVIVLGEGLVSVVEQHPVTLMDSGLNVLKVGRCDYGVGALTPMFVAKFRWSSPHLPSQYQSKVHYGFILVDAKNVRLSDGKLFIATDGMNYSAVGFDVKLREPSACLVPIIWDEEWKKYGNQLPDVIGVQDRVEIESVR